MTNSFVLSVISQAILGIKRKLPFVTLHMTVTDFPSAAQASLRETAVPWRV